MEKWLTGLNADPLPWLLEEDADNPGVRYFVLRNLLDRPAGDAELVAAQKAVMTSGPVPVILDNMQPGGYWVEPGPGYLPKYTSTLWQVTFLAMFGADGADERVKQAGEYILENTRCETGGFSMTATRSGLIHCMQGNLCAALVELGFLGEPRLDEALDWLARSVTGEGIAPAGDKTAEVRYLRSGNSGPGFSCSANNHLPCAWGAVKATLGLSKVPPDKRTKSINAAIKTGVEFLFSRDPAAADYPMGYNDKPNRSWFQFGYPVGYVTDVLQNLEVLTALGYGGDARLKNAIDLLLGKQDEQGRWMMEYTYNGKTWVDVEQKGQPSKWVTLRALRVLKGANLFAVAKRYYLCTEIKAGFHFMSPISGADISLHKIFCANFFL